MDYIKEEALTKFALSLPPHFKSRATFDDFTERVIGKRVCEIAQASPYKRWERMASDVCLGVFLKNIATPSEKKKLYEALIDYAEKVLSLDVEKYKAMTKTGLNETDEATVVQSLLADGHASPVQIFSALAKYVNAAFKICPNGELFGDELFVRALRFVKNLGGVAVLGRENETESAWRELVEQSLAYCDLLEIIDSDPCVIDGSGKAYPRQDFNKSPIQPGNGGSQYAKDSPIWASVVQCLFDFCFAFAQKVYPANPRTIKIAYMSGVCSGLPAATTNPLHLQGTSMLRKISTQVEQAKEGITAAVMNTATINNGVAWLVADRKGKIEDNKKRGKTNQEKGNTEESERAAQDMRTALNRVHDRMKHGAKNVIGECRKVCKEFEPLTTKKNELGKFESYAPLTGVDDKPIKPDTLAKNYRERFGTKKAKKAKTALTAKHKRRTK